MSSSPTFSITCEIADGHINLSHEKVGDVDPPVHQIDLADEVKAGRDVLLAIAELSKTATQVIAADGAGSEVAEAGAGDGSDLSMAQTFAEARTEIVGFLEDNPDVQQKIKGFFGVLRDISMSNKGEKKLPPEAPTG